MSNTAKPLPATLDELASLAGRPMIQPAAGAPRRTGNAVLDAQRRAAAHQQDLLATSPTATESAAAEQRADEAARAAGAPRAGQLASYLRNRVAGVDQAEVEDDERITVDFTDGSCADVNLADDRWACREAAHQLVVDAAVAAIVEGK